MKEIRELARALKTFGEIAHSGSEREALIQRLQFLEEMHQEAARLLKHGPKGYGGPGKWVAARDAWLQRSGYGVK